MKKNFVGNVKVTKNVEVFVNTKTGEGYDKIIPYLNNLIRVYSKKYTFYDEEQSDMRQSIIEYSLNAIKGYNQKSQGAFLGYIGKCINSKLINKCVDRTRVSKNPTWVRGKYYGVTCDKCGYTCHASTNAATKCTGCGALVVPNDFYESSSTEELLPAHLSGLNKFDWTKKNDKIRGDYSLLLCDIKNVIKNNEDFEIIKQHFFDQVSIVDVASNLNLSQTYCYAKLKKLKKNKELYSILKESLRQGGGNGRNSY